MEIDNIDLKSSFSTSYFIIIRKIKEKALRLF